MTTIQAFVRIGCSTADECRAEPVILKRHRKRRLIDPTWRKA